MTELMPSGGGDYTELGGSKLKIWKGFLKPDFGGRTERLAVFF